MVGAWTDRRLRRRILLIAILVGGSVTMAHRWLDGSLSLSSWTVIHAHLPAIVYTIGAVAAGAERPDSALVFRGLATVVAVTLGFTLVNDLSTLPALASLVLNLLIPATVATIGAAGQS
jgi:hypothetical protein